MKLLALDSSALVASVAVVEDDILIAEYTVNHKKTHSQTLMVMLDEVVKMAEIDMSSVDAIAVAAGPGSFTGLRIGSATAKGLSMALDKPIVAVPTVDALAYNMYGCADLICPIMDARRNQVYTGIYEFDETGLSVVLEQAPMGIDELVDKLNSIGRRVVFLGDAVPVHKDYIASNMHSSYDFAPASMNRQRAASVACLGMNYMKQGRVQSGEEHAPIYLRPSQAERVAAEGKTS